MIDRDEIISRAYHECMREMYLKAQPSVNYDDLIEGVKNGTIIDNHEDPVYDRYYLSQEEFRYILDKYVKAYNIQPHWEDDMEILEKYLKEKSTKDKYIPERTDDDGNWHPGYRGYENVPPLLDQIKAVTNDDSLAQKINDIVMSNINDCKNFYRFDREYSSFSGGIALGCSPTSNSKTVKEYWKKQGKDIEIVERNPLLLWEMDYYGDEFEEVMEEEYGKNWEKKWWNKYKKEQKEKKKERERKLKELQNELSNQGTDE